LQGLELSSIWKLDDSCSTSATGSLLSLAIILLVLTLVILLLSGYSVAKGPQTRSSQTEGSATILKMMTLVLINLLSWANLSLDLTANSTLSSEFSDASRSHIQTLYFEFRTSN